MIIRVSDSAGNEYNLPNRLLKDFERMDERIADATTGFFDMQELCDRWAERFNVYLCGVKS